MIRVLAFACLATMLGGIAHAQAVDISPPPAAGAASVQAAAQAADPGRVRGANETGLSARGGANPTGSDRTYFAPMGTRIYSAVGRSIGTPIGPRG